MAKNYDIIIRLRDEAERKQTMRDVQMIRGILQIRNRDILQAGIEALMPRARKRAQNMK